VDVAFDASLAYNAYLIDPNPNASGFYVNPYRGLKRQSVVNRSRGGISDLGFTFGGNFSDKLFIGAGVGILFYNYENTKTFSETDAMDTIFDFESFSFEERLNTSGAGVNLRFGVLLAPTEFWRIGASVQSPTYSALSETYETSISSNFDNGDRESFVSPYTSEFDYSQDIPLKATASTAFLFGTQGLVSLEYEFQDMSQIVHRSDEQNFDFWAIEMNQEVQQLYSQVHSIRAGAEMKSGPIAYRLGYAHSTSPFSNPDFTEGGDLSQNDISLGLGYRQGKFFMDAALAHSRMKSLSIPYTVTGGTEYGILASNNRTRLMITLGVRL
jgi:hypothetical protein